MSCKSIFLIIKKWNEILTARVIRGVKAWLARIANATIVIEKVAREKLETE